MFNDLDQNKGAAPQTPPVDDIFADTDKASEEKKIAAYYSNPPAGMNISQTEIEAQKIGLAASEGAVSSGKGKTLKMVLLIVLTILVIGLGVVIYFKFLANPVIETEEPVINNPVVVPPTPQIEPEIVTPIVPIESNIEISSSTEDLTPTTTPALVDTDGDGLSDEEERILGTDPSLKDSDGDGLSDYEEIKVYNTNPNLIDSDDDGLSDYEEVMIYKTDPNNPDSDGDGYNDGQEVSGGYNPLGEGKLMDLEN